MYSPQIEASRQARSFSSPAKIAFFAFTFLLVSVALPCTGLCAPIGETGTIHGTVKDPSGAVIPGATVTVTNLATKDELVQRTTAEGIYSFSVPAPGAYVVTTSSRASRRKEQSVSSWTQGQISRWMYRSRSRGRGAKVRIHDIRKLL